MGGIAYGVGVGPGDPELMTQKAIRIIRENQVIAVPGKEARESIAYKIAVAMVPELVQKELVPIPMPMVRNRELLHGEHLKGVRLIESYLDQGKNVVYLTLGDPSIYCSFSYLQQILLSDGYAVETVPGVPSFCAAAARLNLPLTEWDEPLHLVPAVHETRGSFQEPGTYVLMKSSSRMAET
ncbi:MAG: precorrin-2 C(20)-methyltransferase, partial [Clostridia bacterium]|nr:precorrin-2 C(20)-methyltransferase [Clostridia bacterium]